MPNWHIEFEVTAKYLSDAQAAVHGLRGVTGIGVRPIREGSPNGVSRGKSGSITTFLLEALKGKPKITSQEALEFLIKKGVVTNLKKTNANLGNMVTRGHLRRVGLGEFARKK